MPDLLRASLLVLATAQASEVFVTKDAQGRPIYTDRPDSLPAEKVERREQVDRQDVDVSSVTTQKMKSYSRRRQGQAATRCRTRPRARRRRQLTAADKAKRCEDSRAALRPRT